ncbi:nucleotidyltransferase domain-containing protein [Pseudohongiella sp. SYSU M77423]|uniref:nucleotidyltransferase domain-containing protein n=1 Tax=Pseudohongiella sp. SYSU M77423 TaxID=3042312 RepID=UPI0024817D13|nr:nucleotidyltransferase domain-containing protein [Pseudohongiella sp. SYSU M77423]MDH7943699.1 nucleotidyltransferase domain-containing protein [Pseudohongiella sp. SYSU M77423]
MKKVDRDIQRIKGIVEGFQCDLMLFGSYAKREETPFNDIDIAVLSEDIDFSRLESNLRALNLKRKIEIQMPPYKPMPPRPPKPPKPGGSQDDAPFHILLVDRASVPGREFISINEKNFLSV